MPPTSRQVIINLDGVPTVLEVDANIFGTGTVAQRPASGTQAGDIYFVQDAPIYRYDVWDGSVWIEFTIIGPGSSSDNQLPRFDGVTGTLLQGSAASIADNGILSGVGIGAPRPVRLATTAALPANTAAGSGVGKTLTADANGALTVDGGAVATNDRVLVKDEVTASDRGIYDVTDPGSAGTPYILTRSTDFDETADVIPGILIPVAAGAENRDQVFQLTTNGPIVVDTTSLAFALANTNDTDAIHDNVNAEFTGITEKVTPVGADLLLIEDSADSDNKKRLQVGNLPGGGGVTGATRPVRLATDAALPANTSAGSGVGKTLTADVNGALTVDGTAVAVNDRVLVKNEVSGPDRGIYDVTDAGGGASPYILTRATDFDETADVIAGILVPVSEGTANGDEIFQLTTDGVITVDTTFLTFALAGGTDVNAIHDNVAGEIAAITDKAVLVNGDFLLIEDSAAADAKKSIKQTAIDHNQLTNFVVARHIDWTAVSAGTIDPSNFDGAVAAVVQARRTTAYALTTSFADVTLDTTDEENNTAILDHSTTLTDRILIGETGPYRITYHVDLPQPAAASTQEVQGRIRVNDTSTLPGSTSQTTVLEDSDITGNNVSGSIGTSFVATLTDGDFITLQLQRVEVGGSGAFSTETNLIITAVRIAGEPGLFFGDDYTYAESEGESTETGTTYVQKLRLTTPTLTAGDYMITWQLRLHTTTANRPVFAQVDLDDGTILAEYENVSDTVYNMGASGIKEMTLTAAVHTVDIDFRAGTGPARTATIKEARIAIWRVS